MVETRSNNFVLGLVVIFLALEESLAHTHKGQEEMLMALVKGGNALLASGVSPTTLEKENFDGVPNAAGGKNGKLGGRKMMEKAEEAMKGGLIAPTNSGRTLNVPKNPLEISDEPMNYQIDTRMFKPKSPDSKYVGTSGKASVELRRTNQRRTQVSEADTVRGRSVFSSKSVAQVSKESSDSFQEFQSHKLLGHEATSTGTVNLMNKDYSGAIYDNPPQKPPINNFEPLVHENKAP